MAKQRYVNTRFWNDTYISDLDPTEKLIFIYLLTNEKTDLCGIYEIPLKIISMETGIEKEMALKILDRFTKNKKIFYIDGWVWIKNFVKYQQENPKIMAGIRRGIELVPKPIKIRLKIDYGYDIDSLSHSNLNSNLNSNLTDREQERAPSTPQGEETNEVLTVGVKTERKRTNEAQPILKWIENNNWANEMLAHCLTATGTEVPEKYYQAEISKFISYWTERSDGGKKMRWEKEKVFDPKRRLGNWLRNAAKFSKENKTYQNNKYQIDGNF